MIPRSTRARPVLQLPKQNDIPLYTNNINSPSGLFHSSSFVLQREAFRVNALSCCYAIPRKTFKNDIGFAFDMACVTVSFWIKDILVKGPLLSTEIYIPIDWTLERLIAKLEITICDCHVILLLNSYNIKGITIPFNTINSIHDKYKFK